jgi:hypothetical protein
MIDYSSFPKIDAASGNSNPTLSFNVTGGQDYNTQVLFIDIAKSMRP